MEIRRAICDREQMFIDWYRRMAAFINKLSSDSKFEEYNGRLDRWTCQDANFGYMGNRSIGGFKSKLFLGLVYDSARNLIECDASIHFDEYPTKIIENIIYDAFNINFEEENAYLKRKSKESGILIYSEPNFDGILNGIMDGFGNSFSDEFPLVIYTLLEDYDEPLTRRYIDLQCEYACLILKCSNPDTCKSP